MGGLKHAVKILPPPGSPVRSRTRLTDLPALGEVTVRSAWPMAVIGWERSSLPLRFALHCRLQLKSSRDMPPFDYLISLDFLEKKLSRINDL